MAGGRAQHHSGTTAATTVRTLAGPPHGPGAMLASPGDRLGSLIETIVRIVDEETDAIRRHGPKELERYAERKGQALVQLDRLLHSGAPRANDKGLVERLAALRRALEDNRRWLSIHMEAVAEVSAMIVRSLELADSDGTYAHPRIGRGRL